MKLRQNPKRTTTHEAGPVEDKKKYYQKKIRIVRDIQRTEKEAATNANMISLLTLSKSKDPALHLRFWQENLRSGYPVVEIRRSNLLKGMNGLFVTNNCVFLPKGLMYIPNCPEGPQNKPAEEGSAMCMYQFAITHQGKMAYLFPTLEPDSSLPCAQFINSSLRPSQGNYSDNVNHNCRQAMQQSNVMLTGSGFGGFIGTKDIYPGFEVLGKYSKSYALSKVEDYDANRAAYMEKWERDTQVASSQQTAWISEIKQKNKKRIAYWKDAAKIVSCKLIIDNPIISIDSTEEEE